MKGQYDTHPHSESSHRSPSEQGNTLAKRQSETGKRKTEIAGTKIKILFISTQSSLRAVLNWARHWPESAFFSLRQQFILCAGKFTNTGFSKWWKELGEEALDELLRRLKI